VTGNVSVGGTLTYEDVTNIDSVGLITARNGLSVTSGGIQVLAGVSRFNANIIGTATTTLSITAADESSDTSCNVLFATAASGNIAPKTGTNLTFNSANGTLTATTFSGSGASLTNLPAANITGTLPAISGANLTNLPAANLTGTLPAISGANLTNLPADTPTNSDIQVVYTVTANGSSAYRFGGNGIVSTEDNPDVYLIRGLKYRFINNSGGSHPFQIRESSGGSAYSSGVTNNGASSGNIDFQVPYSAPSHLYYQCTAHGGMVGNLYIRGAGGQNTNVGVTTYSGDVFLTAAGANRIHMRHSSGGKAVIKNPTAANLSFGTNNNDEEFVIANGGNIGINKNNPQYSLDIVGDQINLQSNASASNAVVRLRGENASTGGAIVAMNSAGNSGPLEFWNGGVKSFSIGSDNTPAFFSPAVAWHEGPAVLEASNGYAEIFFRSTGSTHGTSISGTWGIGKLAGTDGFAILKHGATGGGAVRVDAALSISNTNYITFGKTTRSPKQIGFLVRAGRGGDGYTNNPYQFHTVIKNETSGLSGGWDTTGKTAFTAPVTGFYYFSAHAAYGQNNVSFGTRILRYNSSNSLQDTYELYRFIQGSAGSHYGGSGSIALPLDAGDYVLLQPQYTPYHLNANLNFFSGFLIG
jgi:plastocyanin